MEVPASLYARRPEMGQDFWGWEGINVMGNGVSTGEDAAGEVTAADDNL